MQTHTHIHSHTHTHTHTIYKWSFTCTVCSHVHPHMCSHRHRHMLISRRYRMQTCYINTICCMSLSLCSHTQAHTYIDPQTTTAVTNAWVKRPWLGGETRGEEGRRGGGEKLMVRRREVLGVFHPAQACDKCSLWWGTECQWCIGEFSQATGVHTHTHTHTQII